MILLVPLLPDFGVRPILTSLIEPNNSAEKTKLNLVHSLMSCCSNGSAHVIIASILAELAGYW